MIQLERSMIHKWIIDKNVNSKEILSEFTALLSNSETGFNFEELVSQTITQGRVNNGSTITIGVRLLQSCFYMFGYSTNLEDGRKIFMPSPMTLNILSSVSPEEEAKNYLVNLFCMQYPHPFDWTPQCFKIYFGRLIVKLLLEKRIENKLYIDEFIWFLPFIETIDNNKYEELVESIIEYRCYNFETKKSLFESVDNYQNLFANVTHELNYYFLRLFADFNVFNLVGDSTHNEGKLFKFLHSSTETSKTYRNDGYQSRKKYSGYVELSQVVKESATKLIDSFSPFELPSHIDGEEIFSKESWMTNIYQIEPLRYLSSINTQIDRNSEIISIVNAMITASKFGSRDGKEFENALKPFAELFKEVVNVEILSGAGNTDLLCTMEEQPSLKLYNMNVEAKTRGSALEGVATPRINKHIKKHGSMFCIIIAPKFAKGVLDDIVGNNIVTIRSEEFGNYCFKECKSSRNGFADFSSILDIINNNMGTDITNKVRALTETRYGILV
jgi:hypothetical protein